MINNMINKKKIILYIDTSDSRKTSVVLLIAGQKKQIKKNTNNWTSQVLLPLIDQILKDNDISLSQLTEIWINKGPGSFTGIRVGITIANTLGWLLDIPVNGSKVVNELT